MKQSNELKTQLKQAGASDLEVNKLIELAVNLKQLRNPKSTEPPTMKVEGHDKWNVLTLVGLSSIVGIALGMALVVISQTTLPGSLLYLVQKQSDNFAVSIDPNYRGIVMMKRAQEVKQLVADHASSNLVLATLTDYKVEASAYKSSSTNYAAFEYCKSNLQQAATIASSPERHAIENTLSALQDV